MKKTLLLLAFIVLTASCHNGDAGLDVDVSNVKINPVKIKRYGKALFSIDPDNIKQDLKKLQQDYGIFLSNIEDTFNLIRIRDFILDPLNVSAYNQCKKVFPSLDFLEEDLTQALKHYKYYFPGDMIPGVYTYVSGFDYNHPVQYFNNNLIIGLDNYLGADYEEYPKLGLPLYRIKTLDKAYILRDCMEVLAGNKIATANKQNDLLSAMIETGKKLYFIKAMIPDISDTVLFRYSSKQLLWTKANEANIWAFLIENELLYSSDRETITKFTVDAPFTSYFGNESSPRTGWWVGFSIVKSFMKRNSDVTLEKLMSFDNPQQLLNNSGYKPGS